jgi:pyridoxal phosphate enzyme (YggS family)
MTKNDFEKKLNVIRSKLGTTTLVAVSKYSEVTEVETAYSAGICDFGENRVSDLLLKSQHFLDRDLHKVRWHFIGHLQTNKVKELFKIPNLHAVHSVDSLRLLEELYKKESEFKGSKLLIFLQINTSHEIEKSGFESMEELHQAVELIKSKKNESKLVFHGLMTMGTIRTDEPIKEAERCFTELIKIRQNLNQKYGFDSLKLSMGMSNDYELALKYGSDYIRVGSLLFK